MFFFHSTTRAICIKGYQNNSLLWPQTFHNWKGSCTIKINTKWRQTRASEKNVYLHYKLCFCWSNSFFLRNKKTMKILEREQQIYWEGMEQMSSSIIFFSHRLRIFFFSLLAWIRKRCFNKSLRMCIRNLNKSY